jgi:alpha-1,3-rhamnosyl/mannosyltransferase
MEFFTPAGNEPIELLGLRPGSYWLAVGMAERRKNLQLLIDVISRFPRLCTPERPLLVTGGPGWQKSGEPPIIRKLRAERRVRYLGFVPLSTLAALYAQCTAFLMPSLHEGFGLPLAEAIAAGAPAIASDNSALPEVSGGHAIHLGTTDAGAWAEAMDYCLQKGIDSVATAAAKAHIRKFSTDATARAAIASIEAF